MARYIDADKLLSNLFKKIFSAELYGDNWNGQTVDNLLCLGDVSGEIDELTTADVVNAQLAEAMELIETFKSEIELTQSCKLCLNNDENCIEGCRNKSKWKWQHQDRYEKLKSEVGQNG